MSRCNYSGPRGQCTYQSLDDSDFCIRHSKEENRIQGYRLKEQAAQERFQQHESSEYLETVRQEVALLRFMIEERRNLCRNEAEKIAAFPVLASYLTNLTKMVEVLSKLERQTSAVLGKSALDKLGSEIVDIVLDELRDVEDKETIVDKLADRIASAIAAARNEDE